MQARDMERDARELEEVNAALSFLSDHEDKPNVEIHFPGFKDDGRRAAEAIASHILDNWDAERKRVQESFRARKKQLEEKWA
tara:strand:- start:414 stop:659 length:246 start_codon:yes stop_codon:yes gene_type:complete